MNGLKMEGRSKTNLTLKSQEDKVNNYNSLRKSNIKYETNYMVESDHANQKNLVIYSPSSKNTLKESSIFPNECEFYKSADGTQYKRMGTGDGCIETTVDFPKNVLHIPGKYHEHYRHCVVAEEIPQNLKAKFGSKHTEYLLKDQVKVHDTLSAIQNHGIIKKVDKTKSEHYENDDRMSNPRAPGNKNEDYLDLGNYLRHAVCHGYPTINARGTTFYDYNPETNREFLSDKDNYTKQNRRTKDWLGKWTELSIVNSRQTKELAERVLEKQKNKEKK